MTASPFPSRRSHGFSLIEACIGMAVVGVIAAAAVPGLQSLVDSRRLDSAASQLASDVQFVRSESVARNLALRLTLHTGTGSGASCYVVHTGNAADCRCSSAGPASCTGGAQAIKTTSWTSSDRVALVWNAASLLFDPVHGTSTPTATLRVVGATGQEVRHVVNVMGRVRSCSPNAVAGYRTC